MRARLLGALLTVLLGLAVGGASFAAAPPPGGAKPATARVGKTAPDFTAEAYHQGKVQKLKLSAYRGKWVVLCFYPADFTFV